MAWATCLTGDGANATDCRVQRVAMARLITLIWDRKCL